jgi:hypothetical protein
MELFFIMSQQDYSNHPSDQIQKLAESVAICETLAEDRFNWGDGTETSPPFLVYLGCNKAEIAGYIKTLNIFYRCYWCEVRKPKHLKNFEAEIKIQAMQRESDSYALGLDSLLESEEAKHIGTNYDEYEYYAHGVMQRW